jgi:hypothetical protein
VKFDDVVRPEARDIARKIADLCQFDPKDVPTLQDLTKQLNGAQVLTDPTAGPFGQHLKENAPDAPIGVPLLIGQGLADVVVYPQVNDTYVDERCAAGQSLEYWRVPDRDHGAISPRTARSRTSSSRGPRTGSTAHRRRPAANGDERPVPTTSATCANGREGDDRWA